jgi:class 3 adenylate cyclase/tetratricopeptide (TPR) repeat protein
MGSTDVGLGGQSQAAISQTRLQQFMPKDLEAKLQTARESGGMQGERRIVTILFCDVAGSTLAAEKLDPEDWTDIMNGAFEYLIEPVYRYEGTVARLMGDAILAFFGAPIAHEDDPRRAALAGLEIVKRIQDYKAKVKQEFGIDFDVRVGINTGLVVIGEVGSDLAVEYTAMGDAVNLASRIEASAEPGTVQVSANTHKLIAPLFDFDDLGEIQVKGKIEPVQAYRVLKPKAEPGQIRGIKGLDSPLIGRDDEMNKLKRVVEELQDGRGQVVSVMGEAGLGKSRLVTEFRQSLESEGILSFSENGKPPSDLSWHEGRSLSYETSTPYAPFIVLLNQYFALQTDPNIEDKYEYIKAALTHKFPSKVANTAPYIATMLGIQVTGEDFELVRHLGPPQLRERVFQSVASLFVEMAEERPLVLVLDDLHWADSISLDLLEQLMVLTDRVPILIIAIFRPQRHEPSWRFHESATRDYAHRYTSIELNPLDEESSRELVANLLHVDDLPQSVRSLIMEKAEGNPFFVEEVIRSMLDAELVVRKDGHWHATRAIKDIAVPDTLVGVITSRLDRLDEETKKFAQAASVIGRQFDVDTLTAISTNATNLENVLSNLLRRELIYEKSRNPQRVYQFKHALTQETAYASLLRRKCQELHLLTAEYLEKSESEKPDDIARHFLGAGEQERAVPYLIQAGNNAARASSTPEAIDFFNQALEILDTLDEPALTRRAYEGLGGALMYGGEIPQALETYQTMLHDAQDRGDDSMQVSALNKLGMLTGLMMEQFPTAETHLAEAERLARQNEDLAGLAELHMVKCGICTTTGDLDGAIEHLEESTQLGRNLNVEDPLLFGLTHSANTLTFMTRYEEAWEVAQEARQLSEEMGNQRFLSEIFTFSIPFYQIRNGELDLAHDTAKMGVEIAEKIGSLISEWQGHYSMGQIARMKGEYEQAITHSEKALEVGKMLGGAFAVMLPMCNLGTLHLDISSLDFDRTLELHAEAMQLIDQPSGLAWGSTAWLEAGFCFLSSGDLDQADEYFQKGLTVPTTTMHLHRPQLLVGSTLVAIEYKDYVKAKKYLSEAKQFVEDRSMKHEFPSIAFAEGKLLAARGEFDQALKKFERAEETALEIGMRPIVWQARVSSHLALKELGQETEAIKKQNEAIAMIEEIGELFEDEALRAKFLENIGEKVSTTI